MSARRKRKRRPDPRGAREQARVEETEERDERAERPARPSGLFGGALFGSGPSSLPPIGRSLGRGFLAVAVQPALLVAAIVLVSATWLLLVGLGFEGRPGTLAQLLAFPPISTLFDAGVGQSIYGLGAGPLIYVGAAFAIRSVAVGILTGLTVEAVEDGRASAYGVIRGLRAIPTVFTVQALSLSLVILGNQVFPLLGPGIGLLATVAALVGGLFLLGFAPAAAVHDPRGITESLRRSGRAARLPGSNQLMFCVAYFFLALVVPFVLPGGNEITANPSLATWVFVLLVNIVHLVFMAAFAYRWLVVEPAVPEQPVRRRQPAAASAQARRRR